MFSLWEIGSFNSAMLIARSWGRLENCDCVYGLWIKAPTEKSWVKFRLEEEDDSSSQKVEDFGVEFPRMEENSGNKLAGETNPNLVQIMVPKGKEVITESDQGQSRYLGDSSNPNDSNINGKEQNMDRHAINQETVLGESIAMDPILVKSVVADTQLGGPRWPRLCNSLIFKLSKGPFTNLVNVFLQRIQKDRGTEAIIQERNAPPWRLVGFYRHHEVNSRKHSWNLMRFLNNNSQLPTLFIGDFNEVVCGSEQVSHTRLRPNEQMENFKRVIRNCELNELKNLLGNSDTGFEVRFTGTYFTSNWIIDTGASSHVIGDLSILSDIVDISGCPIGVPDRKISWAIKSGTVCLSANLVLKDVLYLPQFACNLLSVTHASGRPLSHVLGCDSDCDDAISEVDGVHTGVE
ncbi:hypothetical protein LIER_14765 [Lithospermum erythrorhizon]|uniref:Retrovirus-related Pol polyprotein from transposon TNT 1-94-like beta-barrel domain-containing protein n=1 Tax=Lithospermum erythrorhizon TaxID=34254 RepID=A0AAV3Q2K9_LITER